MRARDAVAALSIPALAATASADTQRVTTHRYDGFGRQVGTTVQERRQASDPWEARYLASYRRDPLGRIVEQTVSEAGQTRTTKLYYDQAGRLLMAVDDRGETKRYGYGPEGEVAMVLKTRADGQQHLSYEARDGLGEVAAVAHVGFEGGRPFNVVETSVRRHWPTGEDVVTQDGHEHAEALEFGGAWNRHWAELSYGGGVYDAKTAQEVEAALFRLRGEGTLLERGIASWDLRSEGRWAPDFIRRFDTGDPFRNVVNAATSRELVQAEGIALGGWWGVRHAGVVLGSEFLGIATSAAGGVESGLALADVAVGLRHGNPGPAAGLAASGAFGAGVSRIARLWQPLHPIKSGVFFALGAQEAYAQASQRDYGRAALAALGALDVFDPPARSRGTRLEGDFAQRVAFIGDPAAGGKWVSVEKIEPIHAADDPAAIARADVRRYTWDDLGRPVDLADVYARKTLLEGLPLKLAIPVVEALDFDTGGTRIIQTQGHHRLEALRRLGVDTIPTAPDLGRIPEAMALAADEFRARSPGYVAARAGSARAQSRAYLLNRLITGRFETSFAGVSGRGLWVHPAALKPVHDVYKTAPFTRSRPMEEYLERSFQRGGFDLKWAPVVSAVGGGFYQVVDGHHRLRALQRLGVPLVPVLVLDR